MAMKGFDTDNPLLEYAIHNIWGNPEENQQYQVKTVRLSDYFGDSQNFGFMGKWRSLPRQNRFFHVFHVGGLEPGYWNFRGKVLRRNPLDRWVNLGELCQRRGVQLDIYNAKGFRFPPSRAWVMMTYDNLTFIALEKSNTYPMPNGAEMFFRCYSSQTDFPVNDAVELPDANSYAYESMVYESPQELGTFTARWQYWKLKSGFTGVSHNGAYFHGSPSQIPNLVIGDVVEFYHDPTVIRAEVYSYNSLPDFYSTLDERRKLIIHPPKSVNGFTFRYFDDNDYYLIGKGGYGLYFNRNSEKAVRQLTHVDVAIDDGQLQQTATFHPALSEVMDNKILVLVRKTDWEYQWPHEHQRIRYLYRLPDGDILKAMTGERATVPEWAAANLENGAVLSFTRKQLKLLTRNDAKLAVGYNAATRVLADTPLRVRYRPGQRGRELPLSYREACTVYEHDKNGKLLSYYNLTNHRYFSPRSPLCEMAEFTCGHYARELEYVVTNADIRVSPVNGFRVYTSAWSVATNQLVGELTDVTGDTSIYEIINGYLVWKGLDQVNQRGVVLFNTGSLAYTFTLDHIDASLSFAITHIYADGGLKFPVAFAQVDIWLNDHPLIDYVDWRYKDGYCYIYNKQFITRAGPQKITVRCHDFWEDATKPKIEVELGFVDGGVIGRFPRYNLREDRVTRTVIGGGLYITDEVPNAETRSPDNLWNALNGRPYMVKHVYQPIKYVEPYDNFPGFHESREVDQRVSDYLTKWLPKPTDNPALPNMQDKYRLFSPFLSVVVNNLIQKLIVLPGWEEGETQYSSQEIHELVAPYLWWLEHDPVRLDFDLRYFAIMPYANFGKLVVTAKELMFIKQVNDDFLNGTCHLEGHFEVNDFVR